MRGLVWLVWVAAGEYADYCYEYLRNTATDCLDPKVVYCAKTFDTSVSASPDTTGSAVMEMIFDFKMEYCVDSTYISTNNELFDDFLRLYFYFDKDDFTMVPADVDLTIVHLGLSNDTVYTIAHSVADHTHPTLGDSYRILLNNIRDNTFNDHFKINAGAFNITNAQYWNAPDTIGISPTNPQLDLYAQPGRYFGVNLLAKW